MGVASVGLTKGRIYWTEGVARVLRRLSSFVPEVHMKIGARSAQDRRRSAGATIRTDAFCAKSAQDRRKRQAQQCEPTRFWRKEIAELNEEKGNLRRKLDRVKAMVKEERSKNETLKREILELESQAQSKRKKRA